MIIRPPRLADFAAWLPLWEGYNAFYGRSGATALPREIALATWARFFDPTEPVHALLAEEERELAGVVHYIFHRSTIQIGLTCYLQDFFTRADRRGRGIGRALIEAVYAAARSAGVPRVYWHTQETNLAAMKLYDQVAVRSGFIVYRQEIDR